jgi:ribosomal protein L5
MNFFNNYYKRIIKQDLINKFTFYDKSLPKIKKITLNFGCKNFPIQKFAIIMLALEIIALKKGTITTAKKPNVLLKIQKGQPAGCKVILKKKEIYSFLTKLNLEIFPKLKNFSGFTKNLQTSSLFFQLPGNKIMLKEFENLYPLFANLPILDIHIYINSKQTNKVLFLAKSMKLPII